VGPLQGACWRRVRAANENSNPQASPSHTYFGLGRWTRRLPLTARHDPRNCDERRARARNVACSNAVHSAHGWPTAEAVEARGGVRSFVHDTRCARNMRAVAATRGWVGQQEGSSWQVKQQQKSVRKSPSPRSTYNGGGDGEATGMRRHSKSWRIRVPTHTKGECDKRTSSDGCQTLNRSLWTPECLAGQRPTLLQCCGRQPLPQRLLSHTASRRRWPFVALTRQRTAAAYSSE
jgi:hypothetical protein